MLTVQAYIDKVWDVDLKNWTRGDALYLQAKERLELGYARDCTVKSIVIFPDNGQALDFTSIGRPCLAKRRSFICKSCLYRRIRLDILLCG